MLAGGAVSGGAFKVGGLKALNDFLVERKITDMDIYVGLSAGAILGASLAAGITPDEMIKVLDGTSTRLDQLRPFDFYHPNWAEFASRPAQVQLRPADLSAEHRGRLRARRCPGCRDAVGAVAARVRARSRRYTRFEALVMACSTTSRRSARSPRSRITSRAASSTTRASSAGCAAASSASRCRTTSAPSSASAARAALHHRLRSRHRGARDLRRRRELRAHDLAGGAGVDRRCRSSTSPRASTASTTSTAACATPRTSTSRSRRAPT